jgi:hypothetical protein
VSLSLAPVTKCRGEVPVVLSTLAEMNIRNRDDDVRNLLREAQQRFPEDFWINLQLGHSYREDRPHLTKGGSIYAAVRSVGSSTSFTFRPLRPLRPPAKRAGWKPAPRGRQRQIVSKWDFVSGQWS